MSKYAEIDALKTAHLYCSGTHGCAVPKETIAQTLLRIIPHGRKGITRYDAARILTQFYRDILTTPYHRWNVSISERQISDAMGVLRDSNPTISLVSDVNGIRFTEEKAAIAKFSETRRKAALTLITRSWISAIRPFIQRVAPERLAHIERAYRYLMEELADLPGLSNGS